MIRLYRERPILVLCMVLANIVLSAWCFYFDPVINNDGVTYLSLAQLILDGNWSGAFDYYSWPFYPMFIALTAKLSFLSLETSAYLLNLALVTSLTLAFVCIVAELSNNNKRIILIAALVILFFPSISKYRSFIIRDFGYLSCYLWSLYFVFCFIRTLNKKHLIGWLTFAALSCLFRFEGITLLLIAPYFLVAFTATQIPHRKLILTSMSITIVIACMALTYWYVNDKYASMIEVAKLSGKDIDNIFDLFLASTSEQLGGKELTTWMFIVNTASNIGDVFYELIRRMAVFYFLFSIYAYIKNIGIENHLIKRVWLVYVIINLGMLVVFSLYNNFLVSRYTMATALTLLILSPFVINRIIESFGDLSLRKRYAGAFAIILLGLTSVEGLAVGTKKNHIKKAGLWAKENLEKDARIYSNDPLLFYYSGKTASLNLSQHHSNFQLVTFIKTKQLHQFDYVLLSIRPGVYSESISRQTLAYRYGWPLKMIDGDEERSVFIFKIKQDKD